MGMNYFNPYMYQRGQMSQMPQMMPFPNYYGFQQNNRNIGNKNMQQPMFMPMYFPMGMNQMNNNNMQNKNINNQNK